MAKTKQTTRTLRQVSCSVDVHQGVAQHRHWTASPVGAHFVDTLCGTTGTGGALHGRGLGSKQVCPRCAALAANE